MTGTGTAMAPEKPEEPTKTAAGATTVANEPAKQADASAAFNAPEGADPLSHFAKQAMLMLLKFAPDKPEEVGAAVTVVARKYAAEGEDAARKYWNSVYNDYEAVFKVKLVMDELEQMRAANASTPSASAPSASAPSAQQPAAPTGLAKVGGKIQDMNAVQAHMLGGVLEQVGLGFIGRAMKAAANMEQTYMGITGGDTQVFKTIGKAVQGLGEKLEANGINTSVTGLKEYLEQAKNSKMMSQAKELLAHSGVGTTLSHISETNPLAAGVKNLLAKGAAASRTP